jgi:hypothetical protein
MGFDPRTATPLDYFCLMFPIELLRKLVDYTNAYTMWKMTEQRSFDDKWVDVTEVEMKAYLGINILMGINELPESDMYWSTGTFIGNSGVQQAMT